MSTYIFWLRRDLRLHDNPALLHAATRSDRLVVLYIHAPDEEDPWAPGAASRWWLHHSLERLGEQLRAAGSKLVIRHGPSLQALQTCIDETGAQAVCWNRLYDPALRERDANVKTALRESGVEARSFNAGLLCEPWTIQTQSGGPYRVFTPFWRALQSGLDTIEPCPTPTLPVAPKIRSESLASLNLLPNRGWAKQFPDNWTPGSAGARTRLDGFLEHALHDYDSGRDLPAEDKTSGLSPHLHFGEIGPREVLQATRGASSDDGRTRSGKNAAKFLSELAWREFAHHLLFHYPDTTEQALNTRFRAFEWDGKDEHLNAWQRGQTGIPIVDAGTRQLWQTGWMHNRVRMIVGSLLTKNLRHHWLEGARWFWDTLVDADLANNTLGWQWIAGCGADAAPYFRIFNPVSQGERFDSQGTYVRRFVPELAKLPDRYIHAPWTAPADVLNQAGVQLGRNYPEPIVDLKRSRQAALSAYDAIKG